MGRTETDRLLSPPIWARGGHLQTLWGQYLPYRKFSEPGEKVEIPVGEDFLVGRLHRGAKPVLVSMFHGLGGDADSTYLQRIGARLNRELGVSVLRMNLRGQGEGFGRARAIYHSGSAPDLGAVVNFGCSLMPEARQVVVGFSLSANMVLNLAAISSADKTIGRPDLVISVNPPIHLETCSLALRRFENRIYDLHFVSRLKKHKEIRERFFGLAPVSIPFGASLYDFDELYTAPTAGFKNREDYYEKCSSLYRLSQIEVPTIILMSEDDPFIPAEAHRNAKLSASTKLVLTKTGGHLGYLNANGLGFNRWMDEILLQWIKPV